MNDNLIEIASRWWISLGGAATTLLRVTLIIVAAWVLVAVLQRAIRTLRERIASRMDDRESAKRAETLGRVFRYLASVVVSLIAIMLVLAELGVSVAPILGAAGVVGLAIGFGAQSLVKDFFTGFFILLENQIRQGDVVKLGDHAGMVEVVTLRYVQLRDYDGNVHYVPNGHISTVINMTRGFSNAVMDIGVAYRENVDEVMAVMRQVASDLQKDPNFQLKIMAELEIAGVDSWADSAVIIRCRFRTLPLEQWGVKREYLRRLKAAFDEHGIEIPYPHMTVYAGQDRQGKAPAFPLQQLATD
ncbi:mechanosensitive ion channel family protein [Hydrogenophaga sp.]|jgi:small-conductance mechanosensitive channel|uniref:mechanosensitive ion channel family protein n=2 Tax=Hydrogenophaga sp. TaxID=1904254 RepID=UPI0025BB82D0|nr:mechanosensitive ion channel family protein [Hydrogenophaga sp.]MDO9132690.1 mechanosensitive ion channel family protein [Hydrogenophaga sp.]MDO9505922.1 mechanosensitive ion channel family protein [Hydrogenophaga sp.]MDP3628881.1 mechanosensitive ion channel family protein [Hydrogenophaga sp.]